MDFEKLDQIARKLMLTRKAHHERETGYIYYHCARVANGALELRKRITEDSSRDDILRAAAMFHDAGKGVGEHGLTGSLIAREYLKDEMAEDALSQVCDMILMHNKRKRKVDMWTAILQDADILDHYGVQEIWMNFYYYAYKDESISESAAFYRDEFPKQAAEHRSLLNFDLSKALFDEKCAFVKAFAKRMEIERTGLFIP